MGLTLSRAPGFLPAPVLRDARPLCGIWERLSVSFPGAIPTLPVSLFFHAPHVRCGGTIRRQLQPGFSSLEAEKSLQPFPQRQEAPGIPSWKSS